MESLKKSFLGCKNIGCLELPGIGCARRGQVPVVGDAVELMSVVGGADLGSCQWLMLNGRGRCQLLMVQGVGRCQLLLVHGVGSCQ